jgi:hypothetical protein
VSPFVVVGSGRGRQIFLFTFVVPIPELFTQVATLGLLPSVALGLGLRPRYARNDLSDLYFLRLVFEEEDLSFWMKMLEKSAETKCFIQEVEQMDVAVLFDVERKDIKCFFNKKPRMKLANKFKNLKIDTKKHYIKILNKLKSDFLIKYNQRAEN